MKKTKPIHRMAAPRTMPIRTIDCIPETYPGRGNLTARNGRGGRVVPTGGRWSPPHSSKLSPIGVQAVHAAPRAAIVSVPLEYS